MEQRPEDRSEGTHKAEDEDGAGATCAALRVPARVRSVSQVRF